MEDLLKSFESPQTSAPSALKEALQGALQEALQDAGCTVRGPASTLAEAERLAGEEGLDAAVMDVNLPGGASLPLGARLAARGVPVIYVTGLDRLPGGVGAVVLRKPVRTEVLLAALGRAVGSVPVE